MFYHSFAFQVVLKLFFVVCFFSENVPRQQQSAGSSPTKLRTGSVSVSSVQSPEDETVNLLSYYEQSTFCIQ